MLVNTQRDTERIIHLQCDKQSYRKKYIYIQVFQFLSLLLHFATTKLIEHLLSHETVQLRC
ncbi:Uncharacterized protein APZ42_024826 [Daphnia magna]|uniref:Uncharacterized protein n=1 Tax=Daphnia magna TaxID=35525 RepID=A0A164TQX5_9CRUS|nr:Uncharacterized protein APZ42_024826 [Daphnia magna]